MALMVSCASATFFNENQMALQFKNSFSRILAIEEDIPCFTGVGMSIPPHICFRNKTIYSKLIKLAPPIRSALRATLLGASARGKFLRMKHSF